MPLYLKRDIHKKIHRLFVLNLRLRMCFRLTNLSDLFKKVIDYYKYSYFYWVTALVCKFALRKCLFVSDFQFLNHRCTRYWKSWGRVHDVFLEKDYIWGELSWDRISWDRNCHFYKIESFAKLIMRSKLAFFRRSKLFAKLTRRSKRP